MSEQVKRYLDTLTELDQDHSRGLLTTKEYVGMAYAIYQDADQHGLFQALVAAIEIPEMNLCEA